MKQTRFHPGSRRTAIAVTAMVIAAGIAVLPGRVSAVTDCLDGPEKTPAWALLSDGAKSRICSGQQPADTAVRRREAVALPQKSWDAIAATAASSADVPSGHVSTAAPSAVPRLADDEKSLVLMEEIRTPARQRQPEVRFTTSETSGLPQVQIAGENVAPPRAILISCARGSRSVTLSSFVSGRRRNVASYDVDESVARMVRDERACRVAVAGVAVPLPAELVRWSGRRRLRIDIAGLADLARLNHQALGRALVSALDGAPAAHRSRDGDRRCRRGARGALRREGRAEHQGPKPPADDDGSITAWNAADDIHGVQVEPA